MGGITAPGPVLSLPDSNNSNHLSNGGFMSLSAFGNGSTNPSTNGFFGLSLPDSATVAAAQLLLAGQSSFNTAPNHLFNFQSTNGLNSNNPSLAINMNTLFSGLTGNPSTTGYPTGLSSLSSSMGSNGGGSSNGVVGGGGVWNIPNIPMGNNGNPLLYNIPNNNSNGGNSLNNNTFLGSLPSMLMMNNNSNGNGTNGGGMGNVNNNSNNNNGVSPPKNLPPHTGGGWKR
jgi:hypothetical protein